MKNCHFLRSGLSNKKDDPIPSEGLVQFLIDYGITHYVTKIQLGAAEYRTMSETNYSSFISGKQTLGVDKIADLALSMSKTKTQSTHSFEVKRIGFMNPGFVVRRGTYDEAVVDVQLESILNLISDEDLKDRLSTALHIYAAHHGRYDIGWRKHSEKDILTLLSRPRKGNEPRKREEQEDRAPEQVAAAHDDEPNVNLETVELERHQAAKNIYSTAVKSIEKKLQFPSSRKLCYIFMGLGINADKLHRTH